MNLKVFCVLHLWSAAYGGGPYTVDFYQVPLFGGVKVSTGVYNQDKRAAVARLR